MGRVNVLSTKGQNTVRLTEQVIAHQGVEEPFSHLGKPEDTYSHERIRVPAGCSKRSSSSTRQAGTRQARTRNPLHLEEQRVPKIR